MNQKYHINLFWSDEDGSWVADVPDLYPCSAFGKTRGEALAEAEILIAGVLESLTGHGDPIPEPRYRPAIYALRAA